MRSIVPDGPLITKDDPRWKEAQYAEMIMVLDKKHLYQIPASWTQLSGPPIPPPEYQGKMMWKGDAEPVRAPKTVWVSEC